MSRKVGPFQFPPLLLRVKSSAGVVCLLRRYCFFSKVLSCTPPVLLLKLLGLRNMSSGSIVPSVFVLVSLVYSKVSFFFGPPGDAPGLRGVSLGSWFPLPFPCLRSSVPILLMTHRSGVLPSRFPQPFFFFRRSALLRDQVLPGSGM